MMQYRRVCPLCGIEHNVTNAAYKYCHRHTPGEKKLHASKLYKATDRGKAKTREYGKRYRAKLMAMDPEGQRAKYADLKKRFKDKEKHRRGHRVVVTDTQDDARYSLCRTCPLWGGCHKKYHGCTATERGQKIRHAKRVGLLVVAGDGSMVMADIPLGGDA